MGRARTSELTKILIRANRVEASSTAGPESKECCEQLFHAQIPKRSQWQLDGVQPAIGTGGRTRLKRPARAVEMRDRAGAGSTQRPPSYAARLKRRARRRPQQPRLQMAPEQPCCQHRPTSSFWGLLRCWESKRSPETLREAEATKTQNGTSAARAL